MARRRTRRSRSRPRRSGGSSRGSVSLETLLMLAAVGVGGYYLWKKYMPPVAATSVLPASTTTDLTTPNAVWV